MEFKNKSASEFEICYAGEFAIISLSEKCPCGISVINPFPHNNPF